MQFSSNSERAALVLLKLGQAGPEGLSLKMIALGIDDTKPSTHRTLMALVRHSLVAQSTVRGHYRIGPAVYKMVQVKSTLGERIKRWRPVLTQIGERFGSSCFLLDRSGLDAVIVDMHIEQSSVRILGDGIGGRLPLGFGLGSTAILALQQEDNREAILVANESRYRELGHDPKAIRERVQVVAGLGYDFRHSAFISGVTGVSVPIVERDGSCRSALTVSTLSEQFGDERLPEILAALQHHVGISA